MDKTEQMAADIAIRLNGGEWKDGKWYSEGHRKAWIYAVQLHAEKIEYLMNANAKMTDEIERLRDILEEIIGYDVKWETGKLGVVDGPCATLARKAFEKKEIEK